MRSRMEIKDDRCDYRDQPDGEKGAHKPTVDGASGATPETAPHSGHADGPEKIHDEQGPVNGDALRE